MLTVLDDTMLDVVLGRGVNVVLGLQLTKLHETISQAKKYPRVSAQGPVVTTRINLPKKIQNETKFETRRAECCAPCAG